jgi:hydroxymethylpyrimidine/phosphomethylpyrimidine kinase
MTDPMIPNVLTIAGSDPSGGAGIQADLKSFAAHRTYGCAVLSALTAQNTRRVDAVELVSPAFVAAQLDTLFDDVRIDAVKIGMLATADIVRTVADRLRAHGVQRLVVDPVMVAKSGDRLQDPSAVEAVRSELLPLALVATPNAPEAGVLAGVAEPHDEATLAEAADAVRALGATWVLAKGGHLEGPHSVDLLAGPDGARDRLVADRVVTRHTHGTGCSLSSAIAARLAHGDDVPAAVAAAKEWLTGAIAHAEALEVGAGHGPVHHFHALWSRRS